MRARVYDGRTAAPSQAELRVENGVLVVAGADEVWRWPLDDVRDEVAGDLVRLAGPQPVDARVLTSLADWRALTQAVAPDRARRARARELKLAATLTAVGLSLGALIFFGVPAASGPLARATPMSFERQIGDNLADQVRVTLRPCRGDPRGAAVLSGLGRRLARRTNGGLEVRVEAVQAPFVNAIALPGGTVMITDDLLRTAGSPDELAAVIAHEIAHVERRHVMKAVWRNFGAGLVLDTLVGGGSGAGQQAVLLAGSLSDLRFTREAEAEADARGMALLQAAGLSSEGMAEFYAKLANPGSTEAARNAVELLNTHPDTLRRVVRARAAARPGESALTKAEWSAVQAACDPPD